MVIGLAVVPVTEKKEKNYRCATRLTLHFPGSGRGLPLCQSASVCPFPRPLLVDIPQADPEATVRYLPRGVLIIVYQLSYRHLNARKRITTNQRLYIPVEVEGR